MALEEHKCEDCGNPMDLLKDAREEIGHALTHVYDTVDEWEKDAKSGNADEAGSLMIGLKIRVLDMVESLTNLTSLVEHLQYSEVEVD